MTLPLALLLLAPPAAKTPARPPEDIEVPFRQTETAMIVDATVNGKQVSCMFDTGFSGSLTIENTINLGKPTGTMTLRDFVGEFEAETVKLKSLSLGKKKIAVDDLAEVVMERPAGYSFAFGQHVDGLMGFDVIKHEITEINFEKSKFVFHPPAYDITKKKPDGKRTFLVKLLPIGAGALEMAVETPTGKRIVLALDTGNSFYATTHKDVLERVGLWPEGKTPKFLSSSSVASGTVDSWDYEMGPVKIFGVPVEKSYWDIIDLPSSSAEGDGTVGFGFLKNFNITIDYERRYVWLENWTGKVANEPVGELGLGAGYDPRIKRTVIYDVTPESPAAEAGLKEGDLVVAFDGKEIPPNFGFRRMRQLLRGAVGSKAEVAVSRDGMIKRVTLERRALANTKD